MPQPLQVAVPGGSSAPASLTASGTAGNNVNVNDDDDDDLGSGLAIFFRDFVPHENEKIKSTFSTGLSRLPPPAYENANIIDEARGVEYIETGLSYRQWRDFEKDYLKGFLTSRIVDTGKNESQSKNSCSSSSS